VIGIRGQMPGLGFPAQLQMTVQLYYYSQDTYRFRPDPGTSKRVPLGTFTAGTIQGGVEFTFNPPVTLAGSVTFQWRYHGKLLASVVRQTTRGDKGVDAGDPRGYSAATCVINPT
jgi:hypothetical protein